MDHPSQQREIWPPPIQHQEPILPKPRKSWPYLATNIYFVIAGLSAPVLASVNEYYINPPWHYFGGLDLDHFSANAIYCVINGILLGIMRFIKVVTKGVFWLCCALLLMSLVLLCLIFAEAASRGTL